MTARESAPSPDAPNAPDARWHLSAHLDGDAAGAIDELRAVWDPSMHRTVPAHVSVVYPEEITDVQLLLERAARAAEEIPPFVIRLGEFACDDEGRGGVFVRVHDSAGGLETLRDRLLLPPQRFGGYPFHVTIAHPRTSGLARNVGCSCAAAGSHWRSRYERCCGP